MYKRVFVTPDGQYEFLRATLVRGLKKVLEELSGAGSYIDDIVEGDTGECLVTAQEYSLREPVLNLPNLMKPSVLRTDAPEVGVAAVLLQDNEGKMYSTQ